MAKKMTSAKRPAKQRPVRAPAAPAVASRKASAAKPAAGKAKAKDEVVETRKAVAARAVAVKAVAVAPVAAKAPAAPPKGKPGRKPKAQNENQAMPTDAADAVPELEANTWVRLSGVITYPDEGRGPEPVLEVDFTEVTDPPVEESFMRGF